MSKPMTITTKSRQSDLFEVVDESAGAIAGFFGVLAEALMRHTYEQLSRHEISQRRAVRCAQ